MYLDFSSRLKPEDVRIIIMPAAPPAVLHATSSTAPAYIGCHNV
jgi:hypothetical protein